MNASMNVQVVNVFSCCYSPTLSWNITNNYISLATNPLTSFEGRARSSLPVRWSISTAVSQTLEELDDLYEYLSEDGVQVTNNHISSTNNTNKPVKHSQSLTVTSETNHESMLAVGSTHSLKNLPSQTRTPEMTYDDRQRLEDSIYDDTAVPQEHRTGKTVWCVLTKLRAKWLTW